MKRENVIMASMGLSFILLGFSQVIDYPILHVVTMFVCIITGFLFIYGTMDE